MKIKRYDAETGNLTHEDGSVSRPGFRRSGLELAGRKNLMVAGMAIGAMLLVIGLMVSYQIIFLSFSLLTIYMFLAYLLLWIDGAWAPAKLPQPDKWPDVTLIIPSYNSDHTIFKCIDCCKKLAYPGKVSIVVVDDGSTDQSYEKLTKLDGITLMRKEKNAGKAAALNYAISRVHTEIIGCIDSDSYPDKDALLKCIPHFYTHPKVGSVVLFVAVHDPRNILQKIQEIEYRVSFGFFFKTIASVEGLYVTPGPMALYRKEMFEELGHFDEKNLTEDMEIALRMQRHGWKIRACHETKVETEVPTSLRGLFNQRLRWFRGGVLNLFKYNDMLFNSDYGTFGLFIMPTTLGAGFFSAIFMFWTLMNHARALIDWLMPWALHPAAIYSGMLGNMSVDVYMVDSAIVFGIFNLLIWSFFVIKSFELTGEKIGPKHILPLALMIWVFPMFLGFTFLYAYILEFSGRKYKW